MIENMVSGFLGVMDFSVIMLNFFGVTLGILFGAIPGMTATMGIALCLPITFGMEPIAGMSLLIGLYVGGISGGLISATLLKIPGTPASIATTFDSAPLAARGEAGKALGVGIFSSFIGGIISTLALIFIAPPLAKIALKFGPYEYFSIAIFALTMIGTLSTKSIVKGLLSGALGMFFALIGSAPIDAFPRYTFGIHELNAGFSLLPVLIGLFAIPEIFKLAGFGTQEDIGATNEFKMRGLGFKIREGLSQTVNFLRSGVIGTCIGILPGIGGSTSNLISYITAKNSSKNPEKFGTGCIDGIVASETANNASVGGALIPLLSLGIPGDTVTALLIGGLMIHGLMPGPMLFRTNGDVVYGIFAALLVANIAMLIIEFFGIRVFVKLLRIPKYILLPIVISLCVVGAFALNNRVFDVWTLLIFGIIGYLIEKIDFPLTPIVLGFILGPILETNLRRGLMSSQGDLRPFFTEPISATFLILALISVLFTIYRNKQKEAKEQSH